MHLQTDGRHADRYIPQTYRSGDKKKKKGAAYLLTYGQCPKILNTLFHNFLA